MSNSARGTITGTITGQDGQPVAGASVMIGGGSPRHPDIGAVTSGEGRYRFGGLEPGRYTILVNAEGHPPAQKSTEVRAGAEARLDFRLAS